MATLYERFYNPDLSETNSSRYSPEDIADALLSICSAVEEDKFVQASPESIVIDDSGAVTVLPDNEVNIYFASPEVLLEGKAPDKNAGWFTFGLIAYFIINGRSYYQDKKIRIVDLPELKGRRSELITAGDAYGESEDAGRLFELSIEKLTAWKPNERIDGLSLFLMAIRQYNSTAEIQYICEGETVYYETRTITGSSEWVEVGASINSTNGKHYATDEACALPLRPGVHKYYINVSETSQLDVHLFIKESTASQMTPLISLNAGPQTKMVEIIRERDKRYLFYRVQADPAQHRVISSDEIYYLDVPADNNSGHFLLNVKYTADGIVALSLYNRDGTRQISDNVMQFKI